jgi:epoxyqueuosine reductase
MNSFPLNSSPANPDMHHNGTPTPAERVKATARRLGFDLVGISTAEPFAEDEPRILAWLHDGYQAEMAWMTEARATLSTDPERLLPGAASLIVVGAYYGGPEPVPPDDRPRGRVARYARGLDYHDVMRARLKELAQHVVEVGGHDTRTRIFVDSSPLPERAAAVRAGLGFVGKNTNLLTGPSGSFVLLGVLMTTLALEPDRPVVKDCGQCRLCLDACPTGALPEPYLLDANRCISYLTIEHRDTIASGLRPLTGDHIFGCDICQDVCPWNRANRGYGWPEFRGDQDASRPYLDDLLSLDEAAFRERFRRTPVWRTKRRGLLRNAVIALANIGNSSDLPTLERALRDPEPLVRAHAAWAIGRAGGAAGRPVLLEAARLETDPDVLAEISDALSAAESDHDSRAPGVASEAGSS